MGRAKRAVQKVCLQLAVEGAVRAPKIQGWTLEELLDFSILLLS